MSIEADRAISMGSSSLRMFLVCAHLALLCHWSTGPIGAREASPGAEPPAAEIVQEQDAEPTGARNMSREWEESLAGRYLEMADALAEDGKSEDAVELYARIIDEYPATDAAVLAAERKRVIEEGEGNKKDNRRLLMTVGVVVGLVIVVAAAIVVKNETDSCQGCGDDPPGAERPRRRVVRAVVETATPLSHRPSTKGRIHLSS